MTAQSSVKSSRSFSSNAPTEPTKPVEEIIRYFDERTKRLTIRSTTQTPSGQIIDWIPVESQLANGAVAKPPSASQSSNPLPSPESKEASFELTDPAIPRGPAGAVPVLGQIRCVISEPSLREAVLARLTYLPGGQPGVDLTCAETINVPSLVLASTNDPIHPSVVRAVPGS
jgi:hypothetical protein